jgi:hypothetical protein
MAMQGSKAYLDIYFGSKARLFELGPETRLVERLDELQNETGS